MEKNQQKQVGPLCQWVGISLDLMVSGLLVEIPSSAVVMYLAVDVHSHANAHPGVKRILEVSADARNRQGGRISHDQCDL